MTGPWKIGRRGTSCAGCSKPFEEGEEHFSTVSFLGEGIAREDACAACFGGTPPAEDAFFWKTRFAADRARRAKVDLESLLEAFLRLRGDEKRGPLRYLVALVLLRKRVLRMRRLERGAAGKPDRLLVGVGRKGEVHEVIVPDLPAARIEALREGLRELMGLPGPPAGRGEPDPVDSEGKNCGHPGENAIMHPSPGCGSVCE